MLYDVMIGGAVGEWKQSKDSYGNVAIDNSAISQRIRIAKNLDSECTYIYKSNDRAKSSDDEDFSMCSYSFARNTRVVRNVNNMGMLMIPNRKDDPNEFIYLTINNESGYELIDYGTLGSDIINTYKKKDKYQGCLIQFNPRILKEEFKTVKEIPIFKADLFTDGVIRIVELIFDAIMNEVHVYVNDSNSLFDTFQRAYSERKFLHFRLSDCEGFATNVIFTNEKNAKDLQNVIKEVKIGTPEICVLTDDQLKTIDSGKYKEDKDIMAIVDKYIMQKRIKAVTIFNVKLNKDFLKENNILYLFKYDINENRSYVLRST